MQASFGLRFVVENKKSNPKEPLFQEAIASLKLNCRSVIFFDARKRFDEHVFTNQKEELLLIGVALLSDKGMIIFVVLKGAGLETCLSYVKGESDTH